MMISDAYSSRLNYRHVAFVALMLSCGSVYAQVDSTQSPQPTIPEEVETPPEKVEVQTQLGTVEGKKVGKSDGENYPIEMRSPKKAAIMSAALPGLGQAYNKKYWKIPILYAGFGVAGWYLRDNLRNIERFKQAYIAETDGNPETINDTGFGTQQLNDIIDQYTQWRDLSYIAIFAIYVLNIVDASVDAHLFYFDVSEDISMNLKPYWNPLMPTVPGLTLTMKL